MSTKPESEPKWVRVGQDQDPHAPGYNRVPIWRRIRKGKAGFMFAERRTFQSDSGYDANVRDRFLAMAKEAGARLVVDGEVQAAGFPAFDPGNYLVITVEVLPKDAVDPTDAE